MSDFRMGSLDERICVHQNRTPDPDCVVCNPSVAFRSSPAMNARLLAELAALNEALAKGLDEVSVTLGEIKNLMYGIEVGIKELGE